MLHTHYRSCVNSSVHGCCWISQRSIHTVHFSPDEASVLGAAPSTQAGFGIGARRIYCPKHRNLHYSASNGSPLNFSWLPPLMSWAFHPLARGCFWRNNLGLLCNQKSRRQRGQLFASRGTNCGVGKKCSMCRYATPQAIFKFWPPSALSIAVREDCFS